MKYLTKQWYHAMRSSDLHLLQNADEQAIQPTESYFQECYAQWEQQWMDGLASPEESTPEEQSKKILQLQKEARTVFENNLAYYEKRLPQAIKEEIADLRLLPLYKISPTALQLLTRYCMENDAAADEGIRLLKQEQALHFPDGLPSFYNDLYFHDAVITAMAWEGEDLLLSFDWGKRCRFSEAKILLQEEALENACWLYQELYTSDQGYELHILLCRENEFSNEHLFYFTLRCREIYIDFPENI